MFIFIIERRKFLTDARDSIVGLTHIAWNAIVTHASHQRFPAAFT